MMDELRATPRRAKWAFSAAVLTYVAVISFTERTSVNGVLDCSRLEVGALLFGALAIGIGIAALTQARRHRQQAQQEPPPAAALWARNPMTVKLAMGMAAIAILVGAYRFMWALSVANSCV